ncbi:hypothetical protein BU16DRAFT_560108 [Lophium mytilinum]|uniref:Flavodoxin domain-containing protein n=1 Tax=Lophium mytilinum TaxID=390894 RepID=A0A6A6QWG1_9PEZI|nr:hypothetical protein BU16DRAFT_560108 [Lophium mytilinum]
MDHLLINKINISYYIGTVTNISTLLPSIIFLAYLESLSSCKTSHLTHEDTLQVTQSPQVTMPILVTYASDHGSTQEIAESISSHLAEHFPPTEVLPLADVNPTTISTYTAIVIGSAIHNTHWLSSAVAFLQNNSTALAEVPIYASSVGALAALPKFNQGRWQKSEEKKITQAIEMELKAEHPVLRGHRLFNGRFEKEHAGRCIRWRSFWGLQGQGGCSGLGEWSCGGLEKAEGRAGERELRLHGA